ncbi:MAG: hypothetical protein HQK53_17755 [Oligoflexia bacterium]|nr:hypothetical protein [Oligoflexia bacterium]
MKNLCHLKLVKLAFCFSLCLSSFGLFASSDPSSDLSLVTFRPASVMDADAIVSMHQAYTPDDKSKLLLLPDELLVDAVTSAISKGKVFVATNSRGKIVSYLKAYLVDDRELENIMRDELRAMGPARKEILRVSYNIPAFGEYKSEIARAKLAVKSAAASASAAAAAIAPSTSAFVFDHRDAFIYYGGAYTVESFRSKGIGMDLLTFALEQIRNQIFTHVRERESRYISLIYGQVVNNQSNLGMVQRFARFIAAADNVEPGAAAVVPLHHYMFESYKPEIIFDKSLSDPVVVTFPESGKGAGIVLLYQISK